MRYALMIYSDQEPWFELTEEEAAKADRGVAAEVVRAHGRARARPTRTCDGKELDDIRTAKTVRVRDGEVIVTDGPFAETKEQIGGFFAHQACPTWTRRIEFAAKIPTAEHGSIEVRPVVEQ